MAIKKPPLVDATLSELDVHFFQLVQYTSQLTQRSAPVHSVVNNWLTEIKITNTLLEILIISDLSIEERCKVSQAIGELRKMVDEQLIETDGFVRTHFQAFLNTLARFEKT